MKTSELQETLKKHKAWLNDEDGGKFANLRDVNLRGVNLQGVNLRDANLQGVNLRDANLRYADLQGVNLRDADLRDANLRGANLDYSCWPLWCSSKNVKIDKRIYLQLLAHLCAVDVDDDECKAHQQASLELAKQSHRAGNLGLIESEE